MPSLFTAPSRRPCRDFTRWLAQVLLALTLSQTVLSQSLNDSTIALVRSRLGEAAKLSWEIGTETEALLELDAPDFSVFSANGVPPASTVPSSVSSGITPVFTIVKNIVANRSTSNSNAKGAQPLMQDGSAADPASIGVAVLLANWTGQSGQDYAGAAKDQLDYLLQDVPKTSDGAISHRVSEVQLWSDFVYMVPPFLAYYGALTGNTTLISEAYNQVKLYRNYLRDTNSSAGGLWKHVVQGSFEDTGHWSTGNAWAAAGMTRVLATIIHSPYTDSFKSERQDLANWVKEIHTAMYAQLDNTSIFTNYADQPITQSGSFYDASSTALLASSVYRIALLWSDYSHLPVAEKSRQALSASNSTTSSSSSSSGSTTSTSTAPASSSSGTSTQGSTLKHFTSDGWLTPVVNPHSFGDKGAESAEGQAFVLEMHAAWTEWVNDGSKGANTAVSLVRMGSGMACVVLGVLGVLLV